MTKEYEKLCDVLIEKSGGESECKRFQERVELGNGGIHARLHVAPHHIDIEHEESEFGHRVIIRDVSRSGLGLVADHDIDLDAVCFLKVADEPQLKGSLVYRKSHEDGKYRYGFSLDEWLSDETHHTLSP
ncbi:hypothetical protein A1OO_10520 [Enterovibrio norvegicus FF-33]|uniref:PilZ domain-containing protein n=1 Tax=Enterovibrio norvegicus FF-454 TaxID=1185651 RepID=A0A1E5C7S2_9GAMM|nr:PilZ domain-containing protein [Enterovibrio norvegicus]OEE61519.1 hypothetical protein A1OK_09180 [Enterovibrio norvegicus FF-454]OEE66218.1 hypothetical protein A1OO_10520 [Enterovibrio norvegicus FF-33]OEE90488.1 hypothetical protein A1OQ_00235 [Enterovibrio norvegicus FF-162]